MAIERIPKEELVIKGLVREETVSAILLSAGPLSRFQILEGMGFEVRMPEEEIRTMKEVRRRRKAGQKVMFDDFTSARIELDEVVTKMQANNILIRAISREGGINGVRFYLSSQREKLLSEGVLRQNDSKNVDEFIEAEALIIFGESINMLTGKRKYKPHP